MIRRSLLIIILTGLTLVCPAQVRREMRAAWIATVKNIDWPSEPGLSDFESRREIVMLLDSLRALRFNAVVVQVRPTADALYYSLLEPTSRWLTGVEGIMPSYDPLTFIVEEAHRRCLEVHAWLNPFRASMTGDADFAQSHIYHSHPEWFVKYADKYYFNPTLPQTRSWLCSVVSDIVRRYDIDAIHMDDYFYPYPVGKKPFPDSDGYARYAFQGQSLGDFRRECVTQTIADVRSAIKSIKPYVQFGISPFGIWRNKTSDPRGSDTHGLENYDALYADILLWCRLGLIDYVTPQLYWEIGHRLADYGVLSRWWHSNIDTTRVNLYTGLFASQLCNPKATAPWRSGNELCRQMRYSNDRSLTQGYMLYSLRPMLQNPQGLLDSLRSNYFSEIAIPPVSIHTHNGTAPEKPRYVTCEKGLLTWYSPPSTDPSNQVAYYIIYSGERPIGITRDNYYWLQGDTTELSVSAVNRIKIESERVRP